MSSDSASPVVTTKSAAPASPVAWLCPACRGVRSVNPGTCPRCGSALERGLLSGDTGPRSPELRNTIRRMVIGLLFGIPLIGVGVVESGVSARLVSNEIGKKELLLLQTMLCIPIVFYCASPILSRAWMSLRTRRPTVDTLLGLGISAAFLYSIAAVVYFFSGVGPLTPNAKFELQPELKGGVQAVAPSQEGTLDPFFESAAMITLLALVGNALELRARERSLRALQKLTPLAPKTACVLLPNGSEEEREIQQVQRGDLVRVKPAERIPVDGVIREGITTIDESMLTGEATRAERGPGGRVFAGSENGLRAITVEATNAGTERLLDQVIGLVGQAQLHRAASERATDRLVVWYVPAVLFVAIATAIVWSILGPEESAFTYAAVCAIAVLVVACPCAVGLATSVATVVGMRRAAKAGILFRDAAALERLAAVDTILFDKTGTLTVGKPMLIAVVPNTGVSEADVLTLAAAVERGSEHPLGLAIVWEAVNRKLEIAVAEDVQAVVGRGIRGTVNGKHVSVGRLGFIQESGVHAELMLGEALTYRHRGNVVVFVGEGTRCIGLIVMNDPLRASTSNAVSQLRATGLRLILLTGDHAETAQGVAATVGIDEVVADALPVEKFAVVQKLKGEGRVVAMCGDGVNDAPALVAADVGVALGSGTGAAIGTAGVTLVHSDLHAIGAARALSQATVQTIRRNLFLAFIFNVLAIPVAAGVLVPLGGGLINSVWAAAAMSIGSLAVLVNSMRLRVLPLEMSGALTASDK